MTTIEQSLSSQSRVKALKRALNQIGEEAIICRGATQQMVALVVTPDKLTLGSYHETAEAKVISVDGDSYALKDSSEGHLQYLALITGEEFGRVVQSSLFNKSLDPVDGTPLVHDITGETTKTPTVDSILGAGLKWTDKRSRMRGVALLIQSAQFASLAGTSDYKTLSSKAEASVVKATESISDMVVGAVHGIPLVLCDELPNQAELEIASITRASSTATLTTTTDHGLQTGEKITITGATQSEYNVTDAVIIVVDATSFTFDVTGTPATPATGTPAISPRYTAALVAQGAYGRYISNKPETKKIDHAGSSVVTIDTHFRFATTLMRHNPRRVIRFVTH